MTLSIQEIKDGLPQELEAFGKLVASLTPEQLTAPTRCAGWTVSDVASHVVGAMVDIINGRVEGQGTEEVTQRQAVERRGKTPGELADELQETLEPLRGLADAFPDEAWEGPAGPGFPFSLRVGVESLWYDAYLHADDIRAALGLPTERGPGLRPSVHHVAYFLNDRGWGPATLALDGVEEVTVGDGSGPRITGDAHEFVLAATGRTDPAPLGLDASVNIYAD